MEAEKAAAVGPYDANALGSLGLFVAFTGHWDEGNALAEKALKLAGPSAAPTARDTRIVHWVRFAKMRGRKHSQYA